MGVTFFKKGRLQTWIRAAGTLLSGGLFVWLVARQDWVSVAVHLKKMPIWTVLLATLLILCGQFANAWRWHVLLHSQRIQAPLIKIIHIVFAGAFASNFLPSTIGGDALRVLSIIQYTEDRALGISSVVIDRVLNVIGMLFFLPITAVVFGANVLEWLATQAMGLAGATCLPLLMVSQKAKYFWKQSLQQPVQKTLKLWLSQPLALFFALIISWISVLVVFLGIWVNAQGIGISVNFYQVVAISALVYLLTLLPVSINGYGVREVAVTALYMRLGASLEQATTLAIVTRLLSLLSTLPGAIWLSALLASIPPITATSSQNGHG